MSYKVRKPKKKERKKRNPYVVDGVDVSKLPIYALENPDDYGLNEKQYLKLWQYGVDTGIVWNLQGWYGRIANDLLQQGLIKYPVNRTYGYYGNPIPTRQEMKGGNK